MSRLRELRKQKGLSQEAVALIGQVDKATVSRYERALVEPQRESVVRIAKGLGVAPRRLWEVVCADYAESAVPKEELSA